MKRAVCYLLFTLPYFAQAYTRAEEDKIIADFDHSFAELWGFALGVIYFILTIAAIAFCCQLLTAVKRMRQVLENIDLNLAHARNDLAATRILLTPAAAPAEPQEPSPAPQLFHPPEWRPTQPVEPSPDQTFSTEQQPA